LHHISLYVTGPGHYLLLSPHPGFVSSDQDQGTLQSVVVVVVVAHSKKWSDRGIRWFVRSFKAATLRRLAIGWNTRLDSSVLTEILCGLPDRTPFPPVHSRVVTSKPGKSLIRVNPIGVCVCVWCVCVGLVWMQRPRRSSSPLSRRSPAVPGLNGWTSGNSSCQGGASPGRCACVRVCVCACAVCGVRCAVCVCVCVCVCALGVVLDSLD
jgi:hypothetical protein